MVVLLLGKDPFSVWTLLVRPQADVRPVKKTAQITAEVLVFGSLENKVSACDVKYNVFCDILLCREF